MYNSKRVYYYADEKKFALPDHFYKYKVFIPKFLDYYRFDFHPNDTDETDIVAQTKLKLGLNETSHHLVS